MPNKLPLILVPGLLCDEALWSHQVRNLSDIAEITVTDEHKRSDDMGAIAESIIRNSPPEFALAGLSMGGYIALEMVNRWPERIKKLALLDTSPYVDTPEQRQQRYEMMDMARERFDEAISIILTIALHPERLDDRELTEAVSAMYRRVGPETFIRQQHAIMSRNDQVPALSNIPCPTCIVCGREDMLTPMNCSEEMLSRIPHAELVRIDDCGHMSTMERPEAVNEVLRRWLETPEGQW